MSLGREQFIMVSTCLESRHNELSHVMHTICTYLQDTFQTNIMFWHSMESQSCRNGQAILERMCIMHRTAGYAFSLQVNEETMTEPLISHSRIYRTQKKLETRQQEEPWEDIKNSSKINEFRNLNGTISVGLLHPLNYITNCKTSKKMSIGTKCVLHSPQLQGC